MDTKPSQPSLRFLNCGTMHPYLPALHTGVTCMLVRTDDGLALVDTGFGTRDFTQPGRVMRLLTAALRSPRDLNETALFQVRRLGYRPEAVRHIIMTHLHLDHAGGLPDFPWAQIHLYRPEYEHVTGGRTGWEFSRSHWAHGPHWVPHVLNGDQWYGFDALRIPALEPEFWLIPLTGHTPGHSGVAVRCNDKWVLHGGDAVPYNVAVDDVPDWISGAIIGPHVPRIRQFMKDYPEVQVVGAHMEIDFYPRI